MIRFFYLEMCILFFVIAGVTFFGFRQVRHDLAVFATMNCIEKCYEASAHLDHGCVETCMLSEPLRKL